MSEETKEKLDTIGREEIVERLYTIIESASENKRNISFALNGVWGSGKTFVIEMLEKKLRVIQSEETADDRYFVIHYDCWQYDYYEEPLVAIVSAMLDALNNDHIIKDEKARITIKEVFKKIGMALLFLGNAAVKKATNIDVKDTISKAIKDAKKVKENVDGKIKENHKFDVYFDLKKVLKELRTALKQLSQEFTLVFVVDELDRCLPEYSIKILERLHHLTEGIENTITLIATDKTKLEKTINTIYGLDNSGTDYCSKYLQKFINFSVKLDIGQSNENVLDKYKDYLSLFNDSLFRINDINFIELFNILFKEVDVREQEIIMNKILLVHKFVTNKQSDRSLMYLEMILTIIEKYNNARIANYFDGKNFISHIKNGTIINNKFVKLNDIFNVNFNLYSGVNKRPVVEMRHGIKGFVLFVISYLRVNCEIDKAGITTDRNYIPYPIFEEQINQINKFRELMSTID